MKEFLKELERLRDIPKETHFTVLDLFSGIGGFGLAAEWAGGRTIAFSENAKYPSLILKKRFPDIPNVGDITKLCRRTYEQEKETEEFIWCPRCSTSEKIDFGECDCIGTDQFIDTYGSPDVITGGVPCQPVSVAGNRRGSSDQRWMWNDTLRVISQLRPKYVLLENPEALRKIENGKAFSEICKEFTKIGYDMQWHPISGSNLGAGHKRQRLWILATNSDIKRLEGHAGHDSIREKKDEDRYPSPQNLSLRKIYSKRWYQSESPVLPVVDGLSAGVAKRQMTAIGNSLIPQIAYIFMKAIAKQLKNKS